MQAEGVSKIIKGHYVSLRLICMVNLIKY